MSEAITQTEISHEPTLFAEQLFSIHGFPVTNALVTTWVVVGVVAVLAIFIRMRLAKIPRGLQNFFEIIIEGAMTMTDTVTGSRLKTKKLFPLVFAFFIFILLNNWLGIFPGIGSIGQIVSEDGHKVFVPWLRGGTADLNTTLALALVSAVATHIFGIAAVGIWKYLNKFINIEAFLEIPKKILREPTIILVNPIKFFVGLIEVVGELAKVASLSLRLFGNMFAGEVLLASIAVMAAFLAPIPFMFLELIVGVVQALVFSMLTLVFLTIATEEHH